MTRNLLACSAAPQPTAPPRSANSAANCIFSVRISITFILPLLNQQEKQVLNKKSKQENGNKSYHPEE
jgi:hypothetical protein